ncbi:unnamed protein product, partial [Prunus brigantina]
WSWCCHPNFRPQEARLAAWMMMWLKNSWARGRRPKEELLAVAFNEGVPISKVFIDCGATVNILPCSLMRKLAKTREDLIPSDVVMSSFVSDKSKTIGVLPPGRVHTILPLPTLVFLGWPKGIYTPGRRE